MLYALIDIDQNIHAMDTITSIYVSKKDLIYQLIYKLKNPQIAILC